MKLDPESLDYLVEVVKATKALGVESLIIEPDCIRAADEDIKRVVLHKQNVKPMPFGSIGITRLDVFLDRYELAKTTAGMYIEYTTRGEDPMVCIKDDKNAMFAHTLQFKGKGLKLDFRPSNPLVIRAPRNMKDRLKYRLLVTDELTQFIDKGKRALGTDEFTLLINDEGAFIEMTDINNDKLSFQFADNVEKVNDDDEGKPMYSAAFPIAYVLPLFKNNSGSSFQISEKVGYIEMAVNNLTSLILPRV